jgi:hypothetical protein
MQLCVPTLASLGAQLAGFPFSGDNFKLVKTDYFLERELKKWQSQRKALALRPGWNGCVPEWTN